MEFVSPEQYAKHLATYIASPTKIEALVLQEFERTPPLHKIADWRFKVEQSRRPFDTSCVRSHPSNDAADWQPKTFVPKLRQRERPVERVKDYIVVETVPTNPFIGLFTIGSLIESVARDLDLDPADIRSDRRHKHLVQARSVVVMILKRRGWSYPRIARAVGRGDHSTAINAIRQFPSYAKANPAIASCYSRHLSLMAASEGGTSLAA